MQVCVFLRAANARVASLVKGDKPGLRGADKVDNLHVFAKVLVGGKVGIGGSGDHVVDKGEMLGYISGWPVREEGIEQTLITTIK